MNTILNDDMTLEEKLKAIDLAMAKAKEQAKEESNGTSTPVDPQDLLMCESCQ